jgi:hypothetical protein
MNRKRIDFSALDPTRDKRHLDDVIQFIVPKALDGTEEPLTIGGQVIAWAKPVLAFAAAAALVLWLGAVIFAKTDTPETATAHASTVVLTQLSVGNSSYSTYQILNAIGDRHVEN